MSCCGGADINNESAAATSSASSKYGEPKQFDPDFHGVHKSRSCTDVICCIIFVVFLLGMIVCSIFGYARGNPVKLVYPTDSFGNLCGQGQFTDKKFLFFFDILKCAQTGAAVISLGCPTPQVCVHSCPTDYWSFVQTEVMENAARAQLTAERDKMICKYNVDPQSASKSVYQYVKDEDCAAYYVKSTPVVNRCIPSIFLDITSWSANIVYEYKGSNYTVTDARSRRFLALFYDVKEFVELVYKDILNVWWLILVGTVVAAGLCMLWLVLLRWVAGPVVWLTIALVFGLLIFGSYYSYSEYYKLKKMNATSEFGLSPAFAMNFRYYLSLKKTWLAFGCLTATIIAILLLLFLFLVKRICIAIELIKEASRYIIPMQIFMLFMLLWVLNFIVALGQTTLAGAFSSYYWAWEKPKDIPLFPVLASLHRALRYHLGSLAFGSLIIAVVQLVRVVLEYLEYKLKDAENKVAKFLIRCLKCCFWCLEKFLKFLNKNAYIMIAIHGRNFCLSAKDAFMLIMRNIVRVTVLDKLTDFLLFLSKALVTGAVFTLAFLWFKGSITYFDGYIKRPELNYYLTPVIVMEDLEMNDGSAERPYYMSKGLMKVLGKKNVHMRDPEQHSSREMTSKVSPEETSGRPLPVPNVLKLRNEESMKTVM
ncbi:unnamed protein product [Candidula unifasciata]|uniref:Choline transporter-like protein n=1 Tax=Candidula unifasciata TaxID=100452 RepID=A0A8S3Z016_9EUPU|nr:unnamed protein product [Candidula unifasciata]